MTSKKKRFGTLSVVGEGISTVLRNADNATDGLNIEQVPISRIDPDPDNPRRLGIDREAATRYGQGHPVPEDLQAQWEALSELAQSIHEIGVQQAIKCYRHGDRFRIAFGERRYLASIVAGRETIPAWILDERPPLLRRIQFAENVHRQNLSPWERVANVQALLEEYQATEVKDLASRGLADLLGISHTQANAYLAIIRGPVEVQEWLKRGTLSTLDSAAALARLEAPEQRERALSALHQGESVRGAVEFAKAAALTPEPAAAVRLQTEPPPEIAPPPKPDILPGREMAPLTPPIGVRGRPPISVNLGRTTRPEVVRRIIDAVGGSTSGIEWTDLAAVTKAWVAFLQALERGDF